jgi:hypothetical protein
MKSIIAFFNNEDDVSEALNSLEEAGLDTTGSVSMIMNGVTKSEDKKEEPFDETEEFEEAKGAMSPIEAMGLESEAVNASGIGDIVVAGKILESLNFDNTDIVDAFEENFANALMGIGIPETELSASESRIRSGQILFTMDVEDEGNFDEISMYLSDAGAMLMNYDMELD